MKKNILTLSRDRGSMQAIAPVVEVLAGCDSLEITTLATRESLPVTQQLDICASLMDEAVFAADPAGYMNSVFDDHAPDLVLSGFSPARGPAPDTPEQYSIIEAHRRQIPCVAVQDYWGMYLERLSRDGYALSDDLLPDRLCVLDRHAWMELSKLGVPKARMVITHNPWLDNLAVSAASLHCKTFRTDGIEVLLVSQPLARMQNLRRWPYDQFAIFQHLLTAMPEATADGKLSTIRILPHPSEDAATWTGLLARLERKDVKVELCLSRGLDLLRDADYLVTSHSTLAYDALYFGTPCISLRPAAAPAMHLWIDDAGLSRVFQDADTLRHYLHTSDPIAERQRILKLKSELSSAGLFFSDGKATKRVVAEIAHLLGGFESLSQS